MIDWCGVSGIYRGSLPNPFLNNRLASIVWQLYPRPERCSCGWVGHLTLCMRSARFTYLLGTDHRTGHERAMLLLWYGLLDFRDERTQHMYISHRCSFSPHQNHPVKDLCRKEAVQRQQRTITQTAQTRIPRHA